MEQTRTYVIHFNCVNCKLTVKYNGVVLHIQRVVIETLLPTLKSLKKCLINNTNI